MDTGYAFLVGFFLFWTLQIVVGIIVEVANLGYHRGNFREHTKELYQEFLHRLESNSKKHRTT